MKNRTLIWLLSIASLLLFVLFSLVFKSVISSKNEVLLKEDYANLKEQTGRIHAMKSATMEQYVFDNSYWDELLQASNRHDTAWIETNLAAGLKNFEVDGLLLFDKQGRQSFFTLIGGEASAKDLIPDAGVFLKSLSQKPFRNFIVSTGGRYYQLMTGPVQPSSDDKRETPHQGYFIAIRTINDGYAEKLRHLAQPTTFKITDTFVAGDTLNKDENIIRSYIALNDFNGQPLAWIKSEKQVQYLTDYYSYIKKYVWAYLALMGLILLCYYQFMRLRVLKPINQLSTALEKKNPQSLGSLKTRRDEFAGFAHLVEDSFLQNEKLAREVEARRQSEVALIKSARELEAVTVAKIRAEQDRLAKAEFLSTMSHEIRTPVNGVIGIANLLKDEPLTAHQEELVNTLIFSSNHLLSILTDILDLSKIDSGSIKFDRVSFSLKEICKSVHSLYSGKAQEKQLAFHIKPDDRVQGYLLGDSVRLCQVLNNLVSNAIKFTEAGSVTLQYQLLKDDGPKQTIAFSVHDTGIGIAPDKLSEVFESFSQADRSINSQYGGTGLGLTISKNIIELQGGKITVTSIPGMGSTFSFFLTFDKGSTTAGEQPVVLLNKAKGGNLSGLKVLVAEDNKVNAMVLGKFLEKWNVEMQVAPNGLEALARLRTGRFDIILMDLHMPDMDGIEATRNIRNNVVSGLDDIPIVALTADATAETQKYILANGFNHYLTKPFNPDLLFRILERYHVAASTQ
jgi:signal transduction histidine kinase/CheY-like chemotaxis protein